jgi:anti-sigma-K factor RskA
MTCEDRREQFLLDAVGALEPEEASELHAHLSTGCTLCAGAAAEALAVAATLALQIAPEEPGAAVLARLMKRVRATAPGDGAPSIAALQAAGKRPGFRWFPTIAAAALAAAIAVAITLGVVWSQLRAVRLLKTPDLRYVVLAGSNPQPKARGRIFWDADRGYWHVYVFDLTPPPPGKTFELWFIGNDGRKTRAGLFDVNTSGNAELVVKIPGNVGPLAAAAITDEIAGGAQQPAGTIQLLGKIQ